MCQLSGRLNFTLEPGERRFVVLAVGMDELDRARAFQQRMLGFVHFAHPSLAKESTKTVLGELARPEILAHPCKRCRGLLRGFARSVRAPHRGNMLGKEVRLRPGQRLKLGGVPRQQVESYSGCQQTGERPAGGYVAAVKTQPALTPSALNRVE